MFCVSVCICIYEKYDFRKVHFSVGSPFSTMAKAHSLLYFYWHSMVLWSFTLNFLLCFQKCNFCNKSKSAYLHKVSKCLAHVHAHSPQGNLPSSPLSHIPTRYKRSQPSVLGWQSTRLALLTQTYCHQWLLLKPSFLQTCKFALSSVGQIPLQFICMKLKY